MNNCEDIRARVHLYLDFELQGDERQQFEAHLGDCESCLLVVQKDQRFLESIRQTGPLYVGSPELRERVRSSLSAAPAPDHSDVPSLPAPAFSRVRVGIVVAIATVLVLLLLPVVVVWQTRESVSEPAASSFALMAADTHLRHVRGQLPLEMSSHAPQEVSEWFKNKTDFNVQLPNYPELEGHEKPYILGGARLVAYKNDYAAYVAYEMKNRPISLVITSQSVAEVSGGEEIKGKGLTFHYNAIQGLKVITWSDRGLTYALVSDLEERGQQSCVVCHQSINDQDFIAPLKPQ